MSTEKAGDRELHVVFGAGQVGHFLIRRLLTEGHRVRVAKRSATGIPPEAEAALGDATNASFCREVTEGARVVYHCMNPPYSADLWEELLPRFLANLIEGAGRADARLVVLENLYMLGDGGGRPMDEETPFDPKSRKGEIRARMAEALFEAHRSGDVRAVSGRASDFYGPRGTNTHFGERFWARALRGKPAEFLPNPDTPHTYHFIPDVADGLACLGRAGADVEGSPWMLPCAPAEPSRALVDRFARVLGHPIRLRGMPKPLIKVVGLFMPMLAELDEMLHQWEVPFVVDDTRFRDRFTMEPTDPDEGARRTVAWARDRFGPDD